MKAIKKNSTAQRKQVGVQACIWSEAGVVSSRICTRRLECARCLFDQNMTEFFVDGISLIPAIPQAA